MTRVIADTDGQRIILRFPYDPAAIKAIKGEDGGPGISGRRFVPREKGGPHWTAPLSLTTGRRLRELFGPALVLTEDLLRWGRDEVQKERNLRGFALADDADLKRVTGPLAERISSRPFQRADIAMMATDSVINANQPGTGKTIEVIGAWVEAGMAAGPHLVIAPVRSLDNVWRAEVEAWSDTPIYTSELPAERQKEAAAGLDAIAAGHPAIVAVNADMLRLVRIDDEDEDTEVAKRDHKGRKYGYRNPLQKRLLVQEWASVTIDEFHKMGLNNQHSLFTLGLSLVTAGRRFALSGTPMGGKPIKLFPVLQWCHPKTFTSKWRWAGDWLEIEENDHGKTITNKFIAGRQDQFYEEHARYMVRRLKKEALPGLPEKVINYVMCPMTKRQSKQYREFGRNLEIEIEGGRLAAKGVLAEYSRLKQFANAAQRLEDGVPYPTTNSGKLPLLLEKLDDQGVRAKDWEPGARAIVASESKRMCNMVLDYLRENGIGCELMTGDTKDTRPIISKFEGDDEAPFVIVMTTTTGGVSLNLEAAGSVHALDETWNPDDMEQLFDRGDRGSRTTALICYVYRTRDSIQEYIADVCEGKAVTNANVLDIARETFRRENQQ